MHPKSNLDIEKKQCGAVKGQLQIYIKIISMKKNITEHCKSFELLYNWLNIVGNLGSKDLEQENNETSFLNRMK